MPISRPPALFLLLWIALSGALAMPSAQTAEAGQFTTAAPRLILTPDRAPCTGWLTIRGTDLPPGQILALIVRQIAPPTDHGWEFATATVGGDGAFTLDLAVARVIGDCATSQPPPDGTAYAIDAAPGGKSDGAVYARATFTLAAAPAPGLPNTGEGAPSAQPATEPTLTLTPNQAPCGTTVAARGAGFPPGRTVEVAASGGGEKPTSDPPPTVTVAGDGTFALDLTPCAAPGTAGDGAQYLVYAATPQPDPFLPPDAAARAIYTVGPIGQRPIPTLALAPESGACNGPATASGANWSPGDVLSLTAFPLGGHQGVGFAEVTVGPDGTFTLPFDMHRATLCSARGAPPLGAQYRIGVGPNLKQGSTGLDFASVTYTIARERLTERCFAETGRCVRGAFFNRWERHGLAGNGFPLTDASQQTLEDGNEYTVQYFERVRMELHPENASPYDILLGQFGRRILTSVPDAPTAPVAPEIGRTHFPQTGHNVGEPFLTYWWFNGGLDQFGFPLTEAFEQRLEDGNTYTVQYFERARFEYHPENAAPYDVLLGQFGRRILAEALKPPDSQYPAAGICQAARGAVATVRVNSDTPAPGCQVVRPEQHLQVVNSTGQPVRVRLAQIDVTLALDYRPAVRHLPRPRRPFARDFSLW